MVCGTVRERSRASGVGLREPKSAVVHQFECSILGRNSSTEASATIDKAAGNPLITNITTHPKVAQPAGMCWLVATVRVTSDVFNAVAVMLRTFAKIATMHITLRPVIYATSALLVIIG
jgi:hypothetical protein